MQPSLERDRVPPPHQYQVPHSRTKRDTVTPNWPVARHQLTAFYENQGALHPLRPKTKFLIIANCPGLTAATR